MKPEWESRTLGDICEFVRGPFGGSLKKSIFKSEGFAVYEQQHAINNQFNSIRYFIDENKFSEMQRFELCPGDLIMSCSGTMGKVAIVPETIQRGIINQALLKLTPSEELSVEFLRLWMLSPLFQEQLGKRSKGVAIKNVASVKVLKEISIDLPLLPVQKRIVAILDEAFAGIDTAIANTEKNLANARELFESYLQQVFSQHGDGWVEKTLGDVCQFENGDRGKNYPSRSEFVDSGIAFINAGHIDDGVVDFTKMNYITEENYDLLSRGKIKLGDILFCLRGSLGKFAVIKNDIQGAIASSLVIVRPQTDLSTRFLLHYLRSGLCKSMIEKYAGGAAQPNLGAKDLAKFSISVPPKEQQKVVSEKLDALMLEAERLDRIYREKHNSLKELKQSLLQKAFSGELTTEGDKLMDEAVA